MEDLELQTVEKKGKSYEGIKVLLLFVIAVSLVIIAIPSWTSYKLTKKTNEDAKIASSLIDGSDDNIAQAKNTLFEKGIVGILLNSFDRNTKWSFFVANTGSYVVDASGTVSNPKDFISVTKKSSRISSSAYLYSLASLENKDISSMTFRVQFVKNLGSDFTSDYNHYSCFYSEVKINYADGTEETKNTNSTSLLAYIAAYLQDTIN